MECVNEGSAELGDEAWTLWEVSSEVFLLISLVFLSWSWLRSASDRLEFLPSRKGEINLWSWWLPELEEHPGENSSEQGAQSWSKDQDSGLAQDLTLWFKWSQNSLVGVLTLFEDLGWDSESNISSGKTWMQSGAGRVTPGTWAIRAGFRFNLYDLGCSHPNFLKRNWIP